MEPVCIYGAHTDEEVVLGKEGERAARHVADGDDVSPIRIFRVAPYYLIPGDTRVGTLIPGQAG